MAQPKAAIEKLWGDLETLHSECPVFRQVDPLQFRSVKHRYYDEAQTKFEALGFQKLCDLEDVTLNRVFYAKHPFFVRVLLGPDRTSTAGFYYMPQSFWEKIGRFLGLLPKQQKFVVDLETEFSDGTFLVTTTAQGIAGLEHDSQIHQQVCSLDASATELFQAHQKQLTRLASTHQLIPNRSNTFEDVVAAQHRLQDIKNQFRQEVGYLTSTDMEQIANGRYQKAVAESIQALEQIRTEQGFGQRD